MKTLFFILSFLFTFTCLISEIWALPNSSSSPPSDNYYSPHTFTSGNKYIRQKINSKRNGQVILTYAEAILEQGIWQDGKLMYANKLTSNLNSKLEGSKNFCKSIGLITNTNKFNECLKVYADKFSTKDRIKVNEIFCRDIGLIINTNKFNECLKVYENKFLTNNDAKKNDYLNNKNLEKLIFYNSGTGFAISSNGYVITNNHVIDGCDKVKLHHKGDEIIIKVINLDDTNDLALLKGEFKPSKILPLSIEITKLLQDIYVAGYPFGKNISTSIKVTKGIISSLSGIGNNFSNFQIDAAIQPGNSGGPILNNKGNVIGVVVAKLNRKYIQNKFGVIPENTNFGIKTKIVKKLLKDLNIKLPFPNKNEISKNKLGQNISNSTYYLSCWKRKII
jgi:S1-C subfamily serine protease